MKAFRKYKATLMVIKFQKALSNAFLSIRRRIGSAGLKVTIAGIGWTLFFTFGPNLISERVTNILAFIGISLIISGIIWLFSRVFAIAVFFVSIPIIILIISPLIEPISPNIISSPSPNPIINTNTTASILIKVTPGFKPPYSNNVEEAISNDNPYKCYMVLELRTSEGFKFMALNENLPENFEVEEGYIGQDILKLSINDFPPKFKYIIHLSVYTLSPESFGGTENITSKVIEMHRDG